MKRTLFIFILLIVITNFSGAQTMPRSLMDDFRFTKIVDGTYSKYDLKISDIQGTPYLEEGFSPGKIVTNEGVIYENIPLRYNAYSDDMEFQKGGDTYNIDPKAIVGRAEFGGVIFCYTKYEASGKIQSGFFEILTEGKATLLVKYSVRFLDREEVKAYVDPKPARFDEAQKEHYLSVAGAPAKLITNKKKLLESFGSQMKEMESYISKNRLSVKEDDGLTKIVAHFNLL
jgi:hypothetical protein